MSCETVVACPVSDSCDNRIVTIARQLTEAAREVRILRHVSWDASVREAFFANGARELPQPEYPAYNAAPVLDKIADARALMQTSDADRWLERQALALERSARMLAAAGTADFYLHSRDLYGAPGDVLLDQSTTSLALAADFDSVLSSLDGFTSELLPNEQVDAEQLATEIARAVEQMFGPDAPEVSVVDELSANALAGAQRIRVRRDAIFNDKDVSQLIHHEAGIHVATSLNGLAQRRLPILAASHPGTTRTQEGLAVFSEFITGSMDPDRLRRLSDRIIAIQMAVDGADFLQVYEYFLERTRGDERQAFENARRVFRGGDLRGGAPFTKDIVYLDGLLRVHNFLRSVVASGRADCLPLLFCGKLDLEDIPVLCELHARGLCFPPRFLPSWVSDMRFLLSYLAYSAFLNTIDLKRVAQHYDELLRSAPLVEWSVDNV